MLRLVAPASGLGRLGKRHVHATTPSSAFVVFDPVFADPDWMALSGFLAGYSGLTRDVYALDLRQLVVWCDDHQLNLFDVHGTDIEHCGHWYVAGLELDVIAGGETRWLSWPPEQVA